MKEPHDASDIVSARKRLKELRVAKRESVSESIQRSHTTVSINIMIEVLSGMIYAVGVFYAVRILSIRREFMDPTHYKLLLWAIILISCIWFGILLVKARRNILRLRELKRPQATVDDDTAIPQE